MLSDHIWLPNGQRVSIKPGYRSFTFTLEPHRSKERNVTLPPWELYIKTEPEGTAPRYATYLDTIATLYPKPSLLPAPQYLNRPSYIRPSLQDDIMFLSSVTDTREVVSISDLALQLWVTFYWYFHLPEPNKRLELETARDTPFPGKPRDEWRIRMKPDGYFVRPGYLSELEWAGILFSEDFTVGNTWYMPQNLFITQRLFWQIPSGSFLPNPPKHMPAPRPTPLCYNITNNIRHPLRPRGPRMGQTIYARYIPSISEYLSFRVVCAGDAPGPYDGPIGPKPRQNMHLLVNSDAALIKKWMSQPRVSEFWGNYNDDFIEKALTEPHSIPVIALWDEIPFGFFQIYWAHEDKLAALTPPRTIEVFDRGLHVLIGEDWARARVPLWLGALVHFCFESEPRTESIVLEPRVDNERFLKRLEENGFGKEGRVRFPHKESWLMRLRRSDWEGPAI